MADGSSWDLGGELPKGIQRLSPGIFLNFTPSRRQETASPVLETDSVDTVFTFYYARKIEPATSKSYFPSRSAHPTAFLFNLFNLFIYLFSGRLSLETQYKIEFLVPG